MKTRIITLESHDDLISVRDRLSWAKTPRILLVWPKYEKITLRQVDLKVLQRHAASLGAELGLVSRARRVRADAEALWIPVFTSTGEAQRVVWPKPRRRRLTRRPPRRDLREQREQVGSGESVWRSYPGVRVATFLIGVLAVLSLVALFVPRAEIRLAPLSRTQSLVLPVSASPSTGSVFISGSVPAREKRMIMDGSKSVIVTGSAIVPQSKAQGTMEFRNLTQDSVTIPAGTVVLDAEGVRFVTTEEGEVAAGVGETLELPIEAVEGGVSGNLEAETIQAIEGRLGLSLSAINPEPTTGGRELPSVQASESDRQRAKDLLLEELEEQARPGFTDDISADDLIFDRSLKITQTLLEEYDPPPGAAGNILTVTLQVEFSILYAEAADLAELASLALDASLPAGFLAAESEDVTFRTVSSPSIYRDGSAKWTMRAERRIVQQIDAAQVVYRIQGLSAWNAKSRLEETLPLAADPEVRLSPDWWPWMPIVPFRITVVTK
jgi:hypothetical protein